MQKSNLSNKFTLLFDGSDIDRERLEVLAAPVGAIQTCSRSSLGNIVRGDTAPNNINVVIVSLADGVTWRERLDDIELLNEKVPTVVMCTANYHQRALEGIRHGAIDWLVDGETDSHAFSTLIEHVLHTWLAQQKTQNSLRLHRSVADDQYDLICRFRPDGTLTFVNRAYSEHFNYRVEELEGESFLINIPNEDHERVLVQLAALTPDAPASSFDYSEEVDGHIKWLQWTDSAVFDADGQILEYQSVGTDITVRRIAEQAANDSEARYRALYENAPVMMHVVNHNGLMQSVNRCWLNTLGYEECDLVGTPSFTYLSEESKLLAKANMKLITDDKGQRELAMQFQHANGKLIDVLVTATAMRDAAGLMVGVMIVGVEITKQIAALREQEKEKERLRITLASIGDAVITTDYSDKVDYLNPAAEVLTGWLSAEAHGLPLINVFDPLDLDTDLPLLTIQTNTTLTTESVSARLLHCQLGDEAIVEITIAPIGAADGRYLGRVLVFRDTTEAQALADRMIYHASHDPLTGLINRRAFEEQLQQELQTSVSNAEHVLCFLDLDRFKIVNDSCGHEAGDRVLCKISELMQSRLRQDDLLSRLGGDEFAILLKQCPDNNACEIADNIRADVAAYRFTSQDQVFSFGVSIGLVVLRGDFTVASALRAADSACYRAKEAGRNRVHFYAGEGSELMREDDEPIWAQRITKALDEDRFTLLAQPIERGVPVDESGACFEVLIRMLDENNALIPPIAFIPAAERYGLMSRIDRWVIEHVFDWLVHHHADLDNLEHCAINLSGRSLDEVGFLKFVESAFDSTSVPPNKICFEITETAAIARLDSALRFMDVLKKRGCRFSLDDFGSGLSSFAYLRTLPVDYLKIDGVFVKDILHDETDFAMVRAINEIGHVLGKRTVAEFVENNSIRDVLVELGVDWVQGYGVGKPIPIEVLWKQIVSSSKVDAAASPQRAA